MADMKFPCLKTETQECNYPEGECPQSCNDDPNAHIVADDSDDDDGIEILPQQVSKVVFAPSNLLSEICHTFESFHIQVIPEGGCCMIIGITRFMDALEVEFVISQRHTEVFQKLFEAVYDLDPQAGYVKKSQDGTPQGQSEQGQD